MSGAIWIAAKRRTFQWRRIWPRWRNRKAPLHAQTPPAISGRPLALIGSYQCSDGIEQAARAFAAAAFGEQDAVIIRANRRPENQLWTRIVAGLRGWFYGQAASGQSDFTVPMIAVAAYALLDAGGGIVLINNAARFHEACDIIERTGGRVGCIESQRLSEQFKNASGH